MEENVLTRDIYVYNNEKLNERDYFSMDIKGKRAAIEEILKEYLKYVIRKIKFVKDDLDDLDVVGLMEYLKKTLPLKVVDKVLSSIIFYVMGLIQGIQMFEPDWRFTEDEDAIENPFLTIRGNKLYSLETHKKTDHITTFKLVYTFLQDKMDLIDYELTGDMNDIHKLTLEGGLQ